MLVMIDAFLSASIWEMVAFYIKSGEVANGSHAICHDTSSCNIRVHLGIGLLWLWSTRMICWGVW